MESTEDFYRHFDNSQRTVRNFQDHLTRISSFLCNREVQHLIVVINNNKNTFLLHRM